MNKWGPIGGRFWQSVAQLSGPLCVVSVSTCHFYYERASKLGFPSMLAPATVTIGRWRGAFGTSSLRGGPVTYGPDARETRIVSHHCCWAGRSFSARPDGMDVVVLFVYGRGRSRGFRPIFTVRNSLARVNIWVLNILSRLALSLLEDQKKLRCSFRWM